MAEKPDILDRLATRLKDARTRQGLSLEAVSQLSGVSRSMVSQIERGESSPTVATLWNLTQALKVDFAGLLDAGEERAQIDVLRSEATPTIDNRGSGCQIRILSAPELAGQHEVYLLSFVAGGTLQSEPHGLGSTEQLTVLSGELEITSGEGRAFASAGDTARYPVDIEHSISARTAAEAILVVHGG